MGNSKLNSRKSTILNIRQRRIFSEQFKREKVKEITSNQISISSFCKLWSVAPVTVYRWIYKFSPTHTKGTTMVIQNDSEASKTQELLLKIGELERRLGQKQMALDYLEQLVEVASKELEIDFKKNFKPIL